MATKSAPKVVQAAPDAAEAAPPPKKGGAKKLVLILAVVLLLAGGGGGAAWFFYFRNQGAEATQAAKPKPPKPPVFVNLEPFTVNLQPETGADQFLQVVAVLRMSNEEAAEQVKVYMPELRHRTLLLLSGKRASEIAAPDGREKLAEELRDAVNRVIGGGQTVKGGAAKEAKGGNEAPVQSVFFTSFIVQ